MTTEAPEKPSGSFQDYVLESSETLEATSAATAQKVELFAHGASIGWLGENSGEWCIVTSQDAAVSLEAYVWKGVLYYRNAAARSRYLSVSNGWHYVGFYNWLNARGWTLNGDVLTSLYTNEQLSYWSTDDGYVYANGGNGFTPLTVKFH